MRPRRAANLPGSILSALATAVIAAVTTAVAAVTAAAAADPGGAPAPNAAVAAAKYDTPLRFLRHARESGLAKAAGAGPARAAAAGKAVTVTVKFAHELAAAEIAALERDGASFFRVDGTVAHVGPVYTVTAPWSGLDELAGRAEVARVGAAWRPAVQPLLDVSAHETQADSVWRGAAGAGLPLTGRGMRIADFDTGIDVFHPSFFLADGDTFAWIDKNGNGQFTPWVDAVDKNRNGLADAGETLMFTDGYIYDPARVWGPNPTNNLDGVYQAHWDWLYNDANGNFKRDFGAAAGFGDASPGFGEPLYVALDADEDGALDAGELLVQLGASKVYGSLGAGSVERLRGGGVIETDPDANGHGTAVSGILAGGTVDRHRFTGLAPEAEILAGSYFAGNPISALIPWARARGADVMLYEFGGFVWDFLDGSSLEEELISAMNDTVLQITPSGNLARGHKHAIATVAAGDSVRLYADAVPYGSALSELYFTTLWRTNPLDLAFRLRSPAGGAVNLAGGVSSLDGYSIWFERATSSRGTHALNLYVERGANANVHGTWELRVVNRSGAAVETIDNVADDVSSWAGGAEWTVYYTDQRCVTWPATADDAFVNGSYSTRGFESYDGVGGGGISIGEISAFSGRGARIDGLHLLDLCSPGNYDVYTTMSHQTPQAYPNGSYRQFSGTSAAGPHVAAAAALVRQAFPGASADDVAALLVGHAKTDAWTGGVYNDTWGWGKLQILAALNAATEVEDMAAGASPPALLLGDCYPNPFNPTTWIPYFVPRDGRATLAIYNLRGELVKVLRDLWTPAGAHSVRWQGDDRHGRPATSGVYLCVLRHGGAEQARKITLLR